MFSRKLTRAIAVGVTAIAIGGAAYGIVSATASNSSGTGRTTTMAQVGSNARSGPASGGASGTVASLSASKFTMTTSAGQKVTVDEASSTTDRKSVV